MDSVVLEVAVGLALLYYVAATLVSGVAEGLTRLMNVRSKTLWAALTRLVTTSNTGKDSLGVPLVFKALLPGAGGRPSVSPTSTLVPSTSAASTSSSATPASTTATPASTTATVAPQPSTAELAALPSIRSLDYVTGDSTKVSNIPGKVFAAALLELGTIKAQGGTIEAKVQELVTHYAGTPLGGYLATLAVPASATVDRVTDEIGSWFDAQMVRVTQTYRKNIKYVLAVIGLLVAALCNIDSIHVANALRGSADLRQVVVATAGSLQEPDTACTSKETDPTKKALECGLEDLAGFNAMGVVVPLTDGWMGRLQSTWASAPVWPHLVGIAVTTGAVALGGPMWFDFLMLLTGRKKSG